MSEQVKSEDDGKKMKAEKKMKTEPTESVSDFDTGLSDVEADEHGIDCRVSLFSNSVVSGGCSKSRRASKRVRRIRRGIKKEPQMLCKKVYQTSKDLLSKANAYLHASMHKSACLDQVRAGVLELHCLSISIRRTVRLTRRIVCQTLH